MPGRWTDSQRRERLPPDWFKVRARVRRRASGRCEQVDDNGYRCTAPGTDCHHLGDPQDHTDSNLQLLCHDHHAAHTTVQGNSARARVQAAARHPVERHPGLM